MGFLSRIFGSGEKSEPESPESISPIEEKLKQSDADRLAGQKEKLEELPEDERKDWVPSGDVETQRAVDEEERPLQ